MFPYVFDALFATTPAEHRDVFRSPLDPSRMLIKRVLAQEVRSFLYLLRAPCPDYGRLLGRYRQHIAAIPCCRSADTFWTCLGRRLVPRVCSFRLSDPLPLGDEPFRSSDSNSFGPVGTVSLTSHPPDLTALQLPLALIDSKLLFIVFPFSRWGSLAVSSPDRLPHGPIKRLQEAAVERERWRRSRVRLAPGNN